MKRAASRAWAIEGELLRRSLDPHGAHAHHSHGVRAGHGMNLESHRPEPEVVPLRSLVGDPGGVGYPLAVEVHLDARHVVLDVPGRRGHHGAARSGDVLKQLHLTDRWRGWDRPLVACRGERDCWLAYVVEQEPGLV